MCLVLFVCVFICFFILPIHCRAWLQRTAAQLQAKLAPLLPPRPTLPIDQSAGRRALLAGLEGASDSAADEAAAVVARTLPVDHVGTTTPAAAAPPAKTDAVKTDAVKSKAVKAGAKAAPGEGALLGSKARRVASEGRHGRQPPAKHMSADRSPATPAPHHPSLAAMPPPQAVRLPSRHDATRSSSARLDSNTLLGKPTTAAPGEALHSAVAADVPPGPVLPPASPVAVPAAATAARQRAAARAAKRAAARAVKAQPAFDKATGDAAPKSPHVADTPMAQPMAAVVVRTDTQPWKHMCCCSLRMLKLKCTGRQSVITSAPLEASNRWPPQGATKPGPLVEEGPPAAPLHPLAPVPEPTTAGPTLAPQQHPLARAASAPAATQPVVEPRSEGPRLEGPPRRREPRSKVLKGPEVQGSGRMGVRDSGGEEPRYTPGRPGQSSGRRASGMCGRVMVLTADGLTADGFDR